MNPLHIERYNKEEHGEELISIYRDPLYRQLFRRLPVGLTKDEILNFETQASPGSQLYAIISTDSKLLVGFGLLSTFCNYGLHAQVGMVLKEDFQSSKIGLKNYSFYALKAFLTMIFSNLPIRKLKFKFLAFRKDLEHVFEKYGWVNRTEFKDDCIFDGEFQDELEYSMYRDFFLKTYKD